jgi:chromosome segregation ATPase
MNRYHRALAVLLVSVFGLWGCSRTPTNSSVADGSSSEKLKTVESKLSKLEDEFRVANSARDQLRKKLIEAEESQKQLQAQLDSLKDSIKAKDEAIAKRTAERDQLLTQYDAFRKNVKDLLFKAEEAMAKPPEGSSVVPAIPTSNKKPDEGVVPPLPPELPVPMIPAPGK